MTRVAMLLLAGVLLAACSSELDGVVESSGSRSGSIVPISVDGSAVFELPSVSLAEAMEDGFECRWVVRNPNQEDVLVARAIASCGCVELLPEAPFVVPAGGSIDVFARVTASSPGPVAQSVRLVTDRPSGVLELRVAGRVDVGLGLFVDRKVIDFRDGSGTLVSLRASPETRGATVSVQFEDGIDVVWESELVFAGIYQDADPDSAYSLHIASLPSGVLGSRSGVLELVSSGVSRRLFFRGPDLRDSLDLARRMTDSGRAD